MGALPIALIRSFYLTPVLAYLERERLPYESLLEAVRLSPQLMERPDDLMLLGQGCGLLERIARTNGIEDIGLLAASTIKFESFGWFGDMAGEAETLIDALNLFISRIPVISTGSRLSLNWQGEHLFFSHKLALRPFPGMHYGGAYAVVLMIKAAQLALGPEWKSDLIVLPENERVRKRHHEAFFKTNISFKGDAWAISIPPSRLADPIPKAMPASGTQHRGGSLPSPSSADIMGSLGEMIRPSLRLTYPDIGYAARLAGVSVSTLKRRLSEAGLTYSELVETERLRLSIELLAQDGIQIRDVASELGYTEPGNFTRAFRSWTGLTPSKFRAAQSNAAHSSNKTPTN